MDWSLFSFIIRGKTRRRVLSSLLVQPKTPSKIARELELSGTHVSRSLKELTEKGLTECLTPDQKHGKVYRLTKKGQEIHEMLPSEEE